MTQNELFREMLRGAMLKDLLPLKVGQDCLIFKADKFTADEQIVYVPDMSLNEIPYDLDMSKDPEAIHDLLGYCYTGLDFLNECNGDAELAERLFNYCDWQHPSSALPEIIDDMPIKYTPALEEVVAAANMAGYLEAAETIYCPDDTTLAEAIVDMLNKRRESQDDSDFQAYVEDELFRRFRPEPVREPEITKMIALAPQHLQNRTYLRLQNDAISGVVAYNKDEIHGTCRFGVFVYIQGDWRENDVPADLAACIEFAEKNGCQWIMFDEDAYAVKDLTVFY